MKSVFVVAIVLGATLAGYSQTTCTFAVSGTWETRVCSETGAAPVSGDKIVIPSGVIVQITATSGGSPKHTGDVEISGELEVNFANTQIDGNIDVRNGGRLELNEKLDIGTNTANCGKSLIVQSGGLVIFPDVSPSDKLQICQTEVARGGGGGCNPYPGGPVPYCQPSGGFTGPINATPGGINPLPVTLLYFETDAADEEQVEIVWATAAEENFKEFVVQRSSDGKAFVDLAIVPGQGRDIYMEVSKYQFIDTNPLLGYNYYRLKAVDIDGSFEIFKVRSTLIDGKHALKVYPNPVRGNEISFSLNFNPAEGDRVRVINSMGKEMLNSGVTTTTGSFLIGSQFVPGIYFVQYQGANHKETVRLISF